MQSVSSRIWTRVAMSISYDDNNYTTGTSSAKSWVDITQDPKFLCKVDKICISILHIKYIWATQVALHTQKVYLTLSSNKNFTRVIILDVFFLNRFLKVSISFVDILHIYVSSICSTDWANPKQKCWEVTVWTYR